MFKLLFDINSNAYIPFRSVIIFSFVKNTLNSILRINIFFSSSFIKLNALDALLLFDSVNEVLSFCYG